MSFELVEAAPTAKIEDAAAAEPDAAAAEPDVAAAAELDAAAAEVDATAEVEAPEYRLSCRSFLSSV